MQSSAQNYERITISLPSELSEAVEELKEEFHMSKSEIFKKAFEKFLQDYKKQKLKKIAEMMASEYEKDDELTSFASLDAEDFK